jgi:hypothetical protein
MVSPVHVEDISPDDYGDGVFYLPLGIELRPREKDDWGHPDRLRLKEQVAADRPHGVSGGKLVCLLCLREHPERGVRWMTFVDSGRQGQMFRHETGNWSHVEHVPESDTHKALKERKAAIWSAAGARSVETEEWRPKAKKRPDVFAVGEKLTVAGEVQHTQITPSAVGRRQKALATAGDRVVWTTDRTADNVAWLRRVPHLAVPALDDYRLYRRVETPLLNVVTGWMYFEAQRCGWADLWRRNTSRCPESGKLVACGKLHLYPTLNSAEYRPDSDARFPHGPTMHLDHMLEGILSGTWVPYRPPRRDQVVWVPADRLEQVIAERGPSGDAEQPAPGRRSRREAASRSCDTGVIPGPRPPAVVEEMLPEPEPMCCGLKFPEFAGGPVHSECRMCACSPTWYRLSEVASV